MNFVLATAGRCVKPLFGSGIGRVPFVVPTYKFLWQTFGPRGVIQAQAQGLNISVDSRDWAVAPSLLFGHVWEPAETEYFKHVVTKDSVVVDIGAHVGYYSMLAARIGAKVIAFEPSVMTHELLSKNLKENGLKVEAYPFAIADYDGPMTLYMDKVSPASNTAFGSDGKKSIVVEARKLDTVLKGRKVNVIKMDVEGCEIKALRGMRRTIDVSEDLVLLTEIYPHGLELAGGTLMEYVTLLLKDFNLYKLVEKTLVRTNYGQIKKDCDKAGSINLVCVRR